MDCMLEERVKEDKLQNDEPKEHEKSTLNPKLYLPWRPSQPWVRLWQSSGTATPWEVCRPALLKLMRMIFFFEGGGGGRFRV